MNESGLEIEVKFSLSNIALFEEKLVKLGAELVRPRHHEINLRFDTPVGKLAKTGNVLRLRKDDRNWLTFKGPSQPDSAVTVRTEFEVEVSDIHTARLILEALGYRVSITYEKFRAVWQLDGVIIALDELPYGNFCELEGQSEAQIKQLAEKLILDWTARILESYLGLFAKLKIMARFNASDLTFASFSGHTFFPHELGIRSADIVE